MTHASDLFTVLSSTPDPATEGRSGLGVDREAPRPNLADLEAATFAEPGAGPAAIDASAEAGVEEVLTLRALISATNLALSRARDHFGGGALGLVAAMSLMMSIETDPAFTARIAEWADGLLAEADAMIAATPSDPTAEVLTSRRIAAELDDLALDDADLALSPAATSRAVALELVPAMAEAA